MILFVPDPVSSTNTSPTYNLVVELSTAFRFILGADGDRDWKISKKHKSHKKGPMVDT
jgi:hypothetical protein